MTKYKLIFSLIVTLTAFCMHSCSDDDGYSLDNFTVQLATVNTIDSQSGTYFLILDNGESLWPAVSDVNYSPHNNQRVIVNYTLLSDQINGYDHYVKINGISDILTKNIVELTPNNEATIGNDPIDILQLWPGDHYLNFHYVINVGNEFQHTINLVQNKLNNKYMENDTLVLELRHNANGDPAKFERSSYASFDMKPFEIKEQDSINIKVQIKNINNVKKEYSLIYRYGSKIKSKSIELQGLPSEVAIK